MWPRDHFCDILNKVFVLCPCPKSLSEAKVKNFRLIPFTKEISKKPSIDSVMRLLMVTLMKIYNDKAN